MYVNETSELLAVAEESAQKLILEDRKEYTKILEVVENFARDNDLVVGGEAATAMLTNIVPLQSDRKGSGGDRPDLGVIELYALEPHRCGVSLAKEIFKLDPDGITHYTVLTTRVSGEIFSLAVNARDIAHIRRLAAEGIIGKPKIEEIAIPSLRPGLFTRGDLKCMGGEIQLMATYAMLCNPAFAEEWPSLLKTEEQLRSVYVSEATSKISRVVGGATVIPWQARDQLIAELWKFARGPGRVALERPKPGTRIQLVSSNGLSEEQKELEELGGRLFKGNVRVETSINNPRLPVEKRLLRLTVYITTGSESKEPVAYIYNVAEFELVPYVEMSERKGKDAAAGPALKLASPFVALRFKLVESWVVQTLLKRGIIKPAFAERVLFGFFEEFQAIAKEKFHFPLTFVGKLEDAELARRRDQQKRSRNMAFTPPFYPLKAAPPQ